MFDLSIEIVEQFEQETLLENYEEFATNEEEGSCGRTCSSRCDGSCYGTCSFTCSGRSR